MVWEGRWEGVCGVGVLGREGWSRVIRGVCGGREGGLIVFEKNMCLCVVCVHGLVRLV